MKRALVYRPAAQRELDRIQRSDAGRNHEALALIAQAFEDKAFADEYHRRGQSLLDGLPG
jgi:hypothetical protein